MITLANHSQYRFRGWKRVTLAGTNRPATDVRCDDSGKPIFVLGRAVGNVRVADIWVDLLPGSQKQIDPETLADGIYEPKIPGNLITHFGGKLKVNGEVMNLLSSAVDGAALTSHARWRLFCGAVVDVWLRWYPGESWMHGECLVTNSDQTNPALTCSVPNIVLEFGNSIILFAGGRPHIPADIYGDGQCRAVPFTAFWPSMETMSDRESALAVSIFGIGGTESVKLFNVGNPIYPTNFDARARAGSLLPETINRIYSWDTQAWGAPGIVKESGSAGEQTDQMFVGGEGFAFCGAENFTYLNALAGWPKRPCHHLEMDGSVLNPFKPTSRPRIFWYGRPHNGLWSLVDRLGKPRGINWDEQLFQTMPGLPESHGWFGPDVEHWLMNGLIAAARLTGSPMIQTLLEHQATIYLLTQTTTPGWSTSQLYASRAYGYECWNVTQMLCTLENEETKQRLFTRCMSRWIQVGRSKILGYPIWDLRTNDPRLGDGLGEWYLPWQHGLDAYGRFVFGQFVGNLEMMESAVATAEALIAQAFWKDSTDGRWKTYAHVAVDGRHSTDAEANIFYMFGMPMVPAVLLMNNPQHAIAREIWNQMVNDAVTTQKASWLSPGVPPA